MEADVWYVYVIQSIDRMHQYIGMSTNPGLRLKQHNAGQSKYTSSFRPWEIVYVELAGNAEDARRLEKYYKSAVGRRKIKEILANKCGA